MNLLTRQSFDLFRAGNTGGPRTLIEPGAYDSKWLDDLIGNGMSKGEVVTATTITDYDDDNDGLIEVSNLSQLNAVRWDLDGDGSSSETGYATAFPDAPTDMGCPSTGCSGYELGTDLDFDTDGSGSVDSGDDYWNGGSGWEPIGDNSNSFYATFYGNGNTISNLFIDRSDTDDIGLFGHVGYWGVVSNVGLLSVDVTGAEDVGALVGQNSGTVTSSYATGSAEGDYVGGLVGTNWVSGVIVASYAQVSVTGGYAGGLVGSNNGRIAASYATGSVTGSNDVGGLVGQNVGTIVASYAVGGVTGDYAAGLVGLDFGTIINSYWDTETSGQSVAEPGSGEVDAGVGKTTSELQSPTSYEGVYADWNVDLDDADGDGETSTGADDYWDFGTSGQYPVLIVDFDGNGSATWQEFGTQR